ncbi:hypothetical protein [Streptococcus loxodontisalivarius]
MKMKKSTFFKTSASALLFSSLLLGSAFVAADDTIDQTTVSTVEPSTTVVTSEEATTASSEGSAIDQTSQETSSNSQTLDEQEVSSESTSQTVASESQVVTSETASQSETSQTDTASSELSSEASASSTASETEEKKSLATDTFYQVDGVWYATNTNTGFATDENGETYYYESHRRYRGHATNVPDMRVTVKVDGGIYQLTPTGQKYIGTWSKTMLEGVDENGDFLFYTFSYGPFDYANHRFLKLIDNQPYYYSKERQMDVPVTLKTVERTYYYYREFGGLVISDFQVAEDGKTYYYNSYGLRVYNKFALIGDDWYYFDDDGQMLIGRHIIDGVEHYFDKDGIEARNRFSTLEDGVTYFFNDQEEIVYNAFVDYRGETYYVDANSQKVTGYQTIDGVTYFFDQDGKLAKNRFATDNTGTTYYFDQNGQILRNSLATYKGDIYYLDQNSQKTSGLLTIDGKTYYFGQDGKAFQNQFVADSDQAPYFADQNGQFVYDRFFMYEDSWYYIDSSGHRFSGSQIIDGKTFLFDQDGRWYYLTEDGLKVIVTADPRQVLLDGAYYHYDKNGKRIRGQVYENSDGIPYYYDKEDGHLISQVYYGDDSSWYIINNGSKELLTGVMVFNGENILHLDDKGIPVKGAFVKEDDGNQYYYDNKQGYRVYNQLIFNWTREKAGYVDENGIRATKPFTYKDGIYGADENGYLIYSDFAVDPTDGMTYYYGFTGKRIYSNTIHYNNNRYYIDENGQILRNGYRYSYYFDETGKAITNTFFVDEYGIERFYGSNGNPVHSAFVEVDGETYYINEYGRKVTGRQEIKIDGVLQTFYFQEDGRQYQSTLFTTEDGTVYYAFNDKALIEPKTGLYFDKSKDQWAAIDDQGNITYYTLSKGTNTVQGRTYFIDESNNPIRGQFAEDEAGVSYYYDALGGYRVTNDFIEEKSTNKISDWYYLNDEGQKVTGTQVINGQILFFAQDGKQVKGDFAEDESGISYYYDALDGHRVVNSYIPIYPKTVYNKDTAWYYVGKDGKKLTGAQTIDGYHVYFDENGKQLKAVFKEDSEGNSYYYSPDNGHAYNQGFFKVYSRWYYANPDGTLANGKTIIDGKEYFFKRNYQVKGGTGRDEDGLHYYDINSGERVYESSKFIKGESGNWYYLDENGIAVTGSQVINGLNLFFSQDGIQAKAESAIAEDGNTYYYDKNDGHLLRNEFYYDYGWYYFDENGQKVFGRYEIDGKQYYFSLYYGSQYKNAILTEDDGSYFYGEDGQLLTNTYFKYGLAWYYAGPDGKLLTGHQTINGEDVFFNKNGVQAKENFGYEEDGSVYFYDINGKLVRNTFVFKYEKWYYITEDGSPAKGRYTIDGEEYYFDETNYWQAKGVLITDTDGNQYYYDKKTGQLIRNRFLQDTLGLLYYAGNDGQFAKGFYTIEGKTYYFSKNSGYLLKNYTGSIDDKLVSIDSNGVVTFL